MEERVIVWNFVTGTEIGTFPNKESMLIAMERSTFPYIYELVKVAKA